MYYYKKSKTNGSGLIDSLIGAVTSQAAKEVAKEVGKKAIVELGNRASKKVIDRIIPPPTIAERQIPYNLPMYKGKGLTEDSQNILSKYIPIQDYVSTKREI